MRCSGNQWRQEIVIQWILHPIFHDLYEKYKKKWVWRVMLAQERRPNSWKLTEDLVCSYWEYVECASRSWDEYVMWSKVHRYASKMEFSIKRMKLTWCYRAICRSLEELSNSTIVKNTNSWNLVVELILDQESDDDLLEGLYDA